LGVSVKQWILSKLSPAPVKTGSDVSCMELWEAVQEYRLRELAFHVCVNTIAGAVGKCEFKTFRKGKAIRENEYYLWNVEPNVNQNSTAFLHKLVYQLYSNNEALVIASKHRSGQEMLLVADSFVQPAQYPVKMNEYQGVVVGDTTYTKTFRENEVLHFQLNAVNVRPVLEAMTSSFNSMLSLAVKNYSWGSGKHLKVHINQTQQSDPEFAQKFTDLLNQQIKPFFDADSALLPEYDGYDYSEFPAATNGTAANRTTRDIRSLADDIFDFTARAFQIPPVLLFGDVAGTQDAMTRWLTTCIDPLCDQLQEEINRKRYGKEAYLRGDRLQVDTSTIIHFDMFQNAGNVEKLIGSGAFSINDVLAAANQPRISEPWADAHWLTLNISPIGQAARTVESSTEGGASSG
jgi:HK97 family phage portal protein